MTITRETVIRDSVREGSTHHAPRRSLSIGGVNDPLELEADRIADRVTQAPSRHSLVSVSGRLAARDDSSRVRRQWTGASASGARSAVAPVPSAGWNAGDTTVTGIRRIPLSGITGGNTSRDTLPQTTEAAGDRAVALVPANLNPVKPVDVLLHLHGFNVGYRQRALQGRDSTLAPGTVRDVDSDRIEQQIAATGRSIIGVLPQGTASSGFGQLNSNAYIQQVFRVLTASGAWGQSRQPAVGRVILSGHSGAGEPITTMMAEPGTPRLPTALREVALFDGFRGGGQLVKVTKWVIAQLDHDLAELMSRGLASGLVGEQQLEYLRTSMRFRAYYTNASYSADHRKLQGSIDRWLENNAAPALGASSPLYSQLAGNYKTVPVGHGEHEVIMGRDDRLKEALTTLPVQPKRDADGPAPIDTVPSSVDATLQQPGTHLDPSIARVMTTRLGYDFSRVRIHDDAAAAQSAATIGARAYTHGEHVVFAAGGYAPHTVEGDRLLAHELVHVVQQGAAAPQRADGASVGSIAGGGDQAAIRRQIAAPVAQPAHLDPIHADEKGKVLVTFSVGRFMVFVPERVILSTRGAEDVPNLKVHIFFSAGRVLGDQANDVLTHGIRGASASSDFVTIGVRAHETISNAEVRDCLASIGVKGSITAFRMSGQSRGGESLVSTVQAWPKAARALIEKITLFDTEDNPDKQRGGVTITPKSQLLADAGIARDKILAIEVNVRKAHTRGVHYEQIPQGCARVIGCVRLVVDAMATKPGLKDKVNANPRIKAQIDSLPLPPRGALTADANAANSIQRFCAAHTAEIAAIRSDLSKRGQGLLWFINDNDLARFKVIDYTFDEAIAAHHFFAAEVAHEATD